MHSPDPSPSRIVRLREVMPEDVPLFFEHQQDPEAVRMAEFPSRPRDAFFAHWNKILADESVITRTILYDGQVAGNIGSFIIDGKREVGYWLGKEYWGRGIASAALAEFLNLVVQRPLYAEVAIQNRGSQRVLEKNGFERVRGQDAPTDGDNQVDEVFVYLLE